MSNLGMADAALRDAAAGQLLGPILDAHAIRAVFQPVVALHDRSLVGYEALARGPAGSPLESPDRLFAAARATGRVEAVDDACRRAALTGILAAGVRAPLRLFVNSEPDALAAWDELDELLARVQQRIDVVVELTERALTARPADVLGAVARLRRQGVAIALDDVGADPRSLALMPFLRPEIVKLDLRLVQQQPSPDVAAIVHAVNAYAEREGAIIVAEGIETEEQHDIACALGAHHGQGWLYGRPGPLQATLVRDVGADRRRAARTPSEAMEAATLETPFETVRSRIAPRLGTKRLLLAMSRHLEAQVHVAGDAAVVLTTFQDAVHFTPATRQVYTDLAARAALVGALGVGLPIEPAPGVRGAALEEDEPLRGEWDVVVVSPHFAAAFVARDLGGTTGADMDRRFAFCLTYDRDLVVCAARSLMLRLVPTR